MLDVFGNDTRYLRRKRLAHRARNGMDVRITFHVWKYTVRIFIRETKRKAQNEKNRHSCEE